jgi:hypothetical protein
MPYLDGTWSDDDYVDAFLMHLYKNHENYYIIDSVNSLRDLEPEYKRKIEALIIKQN